MPITVRWDDAAQTIILYTFESPWTWAEYNAAVQEAWQLDESVDHSTDTITDMTRSSLLPMGVLLQNIRKSVVEIPESTQTIVLVGAGRFPRALLDTIRRVYQRQMAKFVTASTLDEARAIIAARRQSRTP